jgi:hypothetical protein
MRRLAEHAQAWLISLCHRAQFAFPTRVCVDDNAGSDQKNQKNQMEKRMKLLFFVFALFFLSSAYSHAQQSIDGKYSGSYPGRSTSGANAMSLGIVIEIKSVEGDAIKGTISQVGSWRPCRGESPAEGTHKDGQVVLTALNEIGPTGCGKPRFKGTLDGNNLVGKWGNTDVKLSK